MKNLLLLILFISGLSCFSQQKIVEVTYEQKPDHTVDFSYTKTEFGSFYLNLEFTMIENSSQKYYRGVIDKPEGTLFTLKPINQNLPIGFSFKCLYGRGYPDPKTDTNFIYLLPVSEGKTIQAIENFEIFNHYFGREKPKNWKAFHFSVNPGDTIFAARKGLVVEIKDGYEPKPDLPVFFSSLANSILVEHEDHTLSRYSVLKNGGIFVKPGDVIWPHDPIGLAGTFDRPENTHFNFFIYYLTENKERKIENQNTNPKYEHAFINPVFLTTEGNNRLINLNQYTSVVNNEIIMKEITKIELKKAGKKTKMVSK